MSVSRQFNYLGQMRWDIPHARSVESSLAADFDLLAGNIIAGGKAEIVKGFDIPTPGVFFGGPANAMQLRVANGVMIHPLASEAGSIFRVNSDVASEVLSSTNPRVFGGFVPSTVNYIGIDLVRTADDSTSDLVQFYDENTASEVPKEVPLARTLGYKIVISTADFNNTPGLAPVCKVTTDSNNHIVGIFDARNMLFRLGAGGVSPNRYSSFAWAGGRREIDVNDAPTSYNIFSGGDKEISSFKQWADSVMTRIWEIGGGQYWYSLAADRNVKMGRGNGDGITVSTPFLNGEYFEWDGTNLHWKTLTFIFDNSPGGYNEVQDQTTDSPGLTDLISGECIYVDLDRENTRTRAGSDALVAKKGSWQNLGGSAKPGSRYVMAWRIGTAIFVRDQFYAVNDSFKTGTNTAFGVSKVTSNTNTNTRVASVVETTGVAIATGVSRDAGYTNGTNFGAGPVNIGLGTNDTKVNLASTNVAVDPTGFMELSIVAEPGTPATGKTRIWLQVNGLVGTSARLQLCGKGPDGLKLVIAEFFTA